MQSQTFQKLNRIVLKILAELIKSNLIRPFVMEHICSTGLIRVKFLIAFSTQTKGNKKYRLKQVKVLPLKHNDIQYSASMQFCPGASSSAVVDLFITLSALSH